MAATARDLIDEYEAAAAARLPPQLYDYFAGGSGDEVTLREAADAWSRYRLRPRVLRDVSGVDTAVEVLGTRLPSPIGCAPIAYQGLLHADGELAALTDYLTVISTRSSRPVEEIGAHAQGPWWLQVYLTADTALTDDLVTRAARAGAGALVLTGDTPYIAVKARAGRPLPLGAPQTAGNFGAAEAAAMEQNPAATTDDIRRLGDLAGLPVLVKGVLRGDDVRRCLDAGAAGVVVSNHGGRQLDRAIASADALREVVDAADGAPVLVDGGVRSGLDVLVALALGARAVLLGRPVAWALAADGAAGVRTLLDTLSAELAHVMGLAGCAAVADATPDLVAS